MVKTIILLLLPFLATAQTVINTASVTKMLYPATTTVLLEGDYIYVRTSYNETQDLVRYAYRLTGTTFPIDFSNVEIIADTTANTAVDYIAGETVVAASDDAAPLHINGTYIGGNHACSDVRVVTATAHGKTTADVGSKWVDGAARYYFIVKIVNANSLWFMSEDLTSGDIWSHNTDITGNLTHVSGATNTGTITVGSYTGGQLSPAIKNRTLTVLLNGKDVVTTGLHTCNFVDIVENYDIIDPSSTVLYLSTHIGETDLTKGDTVVGNEIRYRFNDNGTCVIKHDWTAYKAVNLNYMGFTQAVPMSIATHPNRKMLLPRSLTISDGVTPRDFKTLVDWTTAPATSLNFTSAYWQDAGFPPERAIEYVADGSTLYHGFAHGYSPIEGVGSSVNRVANVNNAWFLYPTLKSYPRGIDNKIHPVAAGTQKTAYVYRSYFDASVAAIESKSAEYQVENESTFLHFSDWHSTGADTLSIGERFNNSTVETIYSDGITIVSSKVSNGQIPIVVNTAPAYVCLKLKLNFPNLLTTRKIF